MMCLAFVLVVILICLLAYLDTKKPNNYPPGSRWWPLLGNALAVASMRRKEGTLAIATTRMAQQYNAGKIVGLKVGGDLQVVVTCVDGVKELAATSELEGRPTGPYYRFRTWGLRRGILLVDEEFWREQKCFLIRHLREFGWEKTNMMESIIEREVKSLIKYFKMIISDAPGGVATVPLHDAFGVSMLNSIWVMLAGERYEPDDIEMLQLQRIISDLMAALNMTGCPFSHFPILRFLAPEASGYAQYMRVHRAFWEELLRHEANHVPGVPRDFMDVYIDELKSRGHDPTSTFSELQLMAICMDMFLAGSDTTNWSLSFAFLHFMRHPRVVAKVQEELDRVDTTVIINVNGYHMDENLFEDPWTFRPERFLDAEGKLSVPDYFLPFGLGRRRCIGDQIAKANVFLFISQLLHVFNFRNPKDSPTPDPFPQEGILPSTQPCEGEISLRLDTNLT
ncbi:hypothetical protein B566_EDAN005483 [Ephemera danica]|nr:hypothetical protein B566_EDAN005483 [Ephemera danica]